MKWIALVLCVGFTCATVVETIQTRSKVRDYTWEQCMDAINPGGKAIFIGQSVGDHVTDYVPWWGVGCFRYDVEVFKICDSVLAGKMVIPEEWVHKLWHNEDLDEHEG